METKLFEVRDRMTYVPVICIKLHPDKEEERYMIAMCGYGLGEKAQSHNILYGKLEGGQMWVSPFDHDSAARTHQIAHQYVNKSWDDLQSGDVIDVEFILGETPEPKKSQRLEKFPKGPVI